MIIFWIALVGAAIYLVIYLLNSSGRGKGLTGQQKSALEILKEMYAKGEITEEEFKHKKNILTGH